MLSCGVRAFDWRPFLQEDGTVYMHHANKIIKTPMTEAMDDILSWTAKNNNGAFDFVMLGITACISFNNSHQNSACRTAVDQILKKRNITVVSNNTLRTMTAADAAERGKLPSGGSMLACHNCWEMHYNKSINCAGFGGNEKQTHEIIKKKESWSYTCYSDSSTKSYPLNRMWSYLNQVSVDGPPRDGRLYSAQALWQESVGDITVGTLHGSSLLKDESKSQLNSLLIDRITTNKWNASKINMVEINNVCDGGVALKKVLDNLV
jgi:hypothetical protein